MDYGEWTGRALKDLAEEKLWRVVQQHPAAARFPGGESLAAVSARAVAAIRDLVRADGPDRRAGSGGRRATPSDRPTGMGGTGGRGGAATSARHIRRPAPGPSSSARTATSSRRCWPTRSACTSTPSSGSSSRPASLSVVRYTALRPFVERINDTGDLDSLRPPPPAAAAVAGADADPAAAAEPDPAAPTDPIAESDAVPGGAIAQAAVRRTFATG